MQAVAGITRLVFRIIAGLCIVTATPILAQATSANEALERYRKLTSVAPKSCVAEGKTDDIVVCANQKLRDSQKVPYIEELRAGDRPRLAPGEVPGQGPGPPCPPRGCPCPPSECGLRSIFRRLSGE